MKITLKDMSGVVVACAPITTDEHGYLYADHPTFGFEVDCALYGYQDGGVDHDVIEDDDGVPYIQWSVQ